MINNHEYSIHRQNNSLHIEDPKAVLTELDESVFAALSYLEELIIDARNLRSFPEIFCQIKVKATIQLRNAHCKALPKFVTNSIELQSLEIDCSQLRISASILELANLKTLVLENFYGTKWPAIISKLPQLKTLIISKKLIQKCSVPQILKALTACKSLQKLHIKSDFDWCTLDHETLSYLNQLKSIYLSPSDFSTCSINIALLDKTKLHQKWPGPQQIHHFHQFKFEVNPIDKKVLFALFFNKINTINPLTEIPFNKLDKNKATALYFTKSPSRNLQKRIKTQLPQSRLLSANKITADALFVINENTDIHELYRAMRSQHAYTTQDHLQSYLTHLEAPWLRQEGSENAVTQIIQLIVSNQAENILLAFQLMDGNGATDELTSMLAAIMMTHPHKEVAKEAKKLFRKIGPASAYDHIVKSKIYFRRSSNTSSKLTKLFKHNFGIKELPFRIMHALISGQNPRIRDARKATLNIEKCTLNEKFPALIAFFKDIKKIKLQKCKNLDTASAFEAMSAMEELLWLDLANCKTKIATTIAKLQNLQYLDLSYNQVADSTALGQLTHLTHLNLEGCKISNFDFLKNLSALQYLNLGRNQLHAIPASVLALKKLRILILKQNKIKTIPKSIRYMGVRELNLSGNLLENIHDALWQIKSLKKLHLRTNKIDTVELNKTTEIHPSKIQEIDLSNNRLLHFSIGPNHLLHLSTLNISKNRLSELDQSIFKYSSMNQLIASDNQIVSIPLAIKNRNFRYINLRNNLIKNLPAILSEIYVERFDLRDNQISFIDNSILQHSQLFRFYHWNLNGNPISSLFKYT